MSKTLLLVQGTGLEFGWLVATYIPAVRHLSRKYDEVIVLCPESHIYLWSDFATEFIHWTKKGICDRWYCNGKKLKVPKEFIEMYPNADYVSPGKKICTTAKREYKKYGMHPYHSQYDLVIHARSEVKFGRYDRNLNPRKYVKLLKMLRKHGDLSACSIGTKSGAYHIPGTEDLRGLKLNKLCNLLHYAKLCIGVSSGPMHLASMCGCPHVVWTDAKYQKAIGGTNKDRYEKIWNPFKTPVKVPDKEGWLPKTETIYKAVKGML